MILKLESPADTKSQDWCVLCKRLEPQATVHDVVQAIVRYATYPVCAYRLRPGSQLTEYLVAFEVAGSSVSRPQFYSADRLRLVVQNIMHPYHRIDTG
jgi:hypothetical protein